jgi:hypothetical protein
MAIYSKTDSDLPPLIPYNLRLDSDPGSSDAFVISTEALKPSPNSSTVLAWSSDSDGHLHITPLPYQSSSSDALLLTDSTSTQWENRVAPADAVKSLISPQAPIVIPIAVLGQSPDQVTLSAQNFENILQQSHAFIQYATHSLLVKFPDTQKFVNAVEIQDILQIISQGQIPLLAFFPDKDDPSLLSLAVVSIPDIPDALEVLNDPGNFRCTYQKFSAQSIGSLLYNSQKTNPLVLPVFQKSGDQNFVTSSREFSNILQETPEFQTLSQQALQLIPGDRSFVNSTDASVIADLCDQSHIPLLTYYKEDSTYKLVAFDAENLPFPDPTDDNALHLLNDPEVGSVWDNRDLNSARVTDFLANGQPSPQNNASCFWGFDYQTGTTPKLGIHLFDFPTEFNSQASLSILPQISDLQSQLSSLDSSSLKLLPRTAFTWSSTSVFADDAVIYDSPYLGFRRSSPNAPDAVAFIGSLSGKINDVLTPFSSHSIRINDGTDHAWLPNSSLNADDISSLLDSNDACFPSFTKNSDGQIAWSLSSGSSQQTSALLWTDNPTQWRFDSREYTSGEIHGWIATFPTYDAFPGWTFDATAQNIKKRVFNFKQEFDKLSDSQLAPQFQSLSDLISSLSQKVTSLESQLQALQKSSLQISFSGSKADQFSASNLIIFDTDEDVPSQAAIGALFSSSSSSSFTLTPSFFSTSSTDSSFPSSDFDSHKLSLD